MAKINDYSSNPTANTARATTDRQAAEPTSGNPTTELDPQSKKPLGPNNFRLMAVAGLMIVVGFLLMLGAPTTTEAFNPDIFSTRRIIIGPTIAFLGFVLMAVAIIIRPRFKSLADR